MKLYGSHMAPNSDRVVLFLAEKGLSVPFVPVDLMQGEHYAKEYRERIAPNARIPALELDDGTVLRESVAICRYFEEIQPAPALMGTTALERAQVEMYQRLMEMELMMPIAMCFRHGHPAGAKLENPQIAQLAEVSRPRAEKRLAVLNKELADREYLAGAFSIADITAFVAINFARASKIAPLPEHTHIQAWMQRMLQRPAIADGMALIKGKR
ncbi:MAG: glutathione S-transferase family protein [Oceanococcaceae bacterium]